MAVDEDGNPVLAEGKATAASAAVNDYRRDAGAG